MEVVLKSSDIHRIEGDVENKCGYVDNFLRLMENKWRGEIDE